MNMLNGTDGQQNSNPKERPAMADLHIMTRNEKIKSIAFMTGKIE
jgi:hypothetical protein